MMADDRAETAAPGQKPPTVDQLVALCNKIAADAGPEPLEHGLRDLFGTDEIACVLDRGGWHRLGGVVDGDLNRITTNLSDWVAQQAGEEPLDLVAEFAESDYLVTRMAGRTYYFTLSTGQEPGQFLQVEIEALQEVVDRPLVMDDWVPDTIAEFIDPVDYPRLDPRPVGSPRYLFRRMAWVPGLLAQMDVSSRSARNLKRFFADWQHSSAGEAERFCRHWVLLIREYQDSDRMTRTDARPLATFKGDAAELPVAESLRGSELAHAIHTYDRKIGYPFAWFFHLLCRKGGNVQLAEAVLKDQVGAYDYLPARDLKVLRAWEERPYSV